MESTLSIRPASTEMIEPIRTPVQRMLALYDLLSHIITSRKQLKVDSQSLISQRNELKLIQTYRTALQEHEEQEQKINRSSTQLEERMRVETEWYRENVVAQRSHPMGIVPQRKIMTRSVTRSQPRVQSKAEQGMRNPSLQIWESRLTRYTDEALKTWKRSMDGLRADDTANRQSMEEEQARWAAEIATNLRDAKALSEAAEASGVDMVAEKASLKLLIDKHNAKAREEWGKNVAAIREIRIRKR